MVKWRRWARELLVTLALAVGVTVAMDALRGPSLPASIATAPLKTVDGEMLSLAAMSAERPLLVYVWASWCAVCRYTTPGVRRLAQSGANVASVALRSGDDERLRRTLAAKRLPVPTVNDANGALVRRWGVSATPTLLIIYRGKVTSATIGWTSYPGMLLRLWWAKLRC
ncbi:protein disulfide oxidoreductase [Erwinia sp. HR93]|uniref:protein disulfide oxidoreductase n=1 Tax=Erwinia sp. HR93 TaxID=3094840 RepID=UPI002ADEC6F8|nr:protein disulfide oxidoreductase [Erwinia sp. HR93]MEA1063479.1 protein disulfide oxidoreductase [Erwinia sp. HR93]